VSRPRSNRIYPSPIGAVIHRVDGDGHTFWTVEGSSVATLMITPKPTWPRELHDAYMRRRDAALFGHCACGALAERRSCAEHGNGCNTFEHEHDCPASDDLIQELIDRWWQSAGRA